MTTPKSLFRVAVLVALAGSLAAQEPPKPEPGHGRRAARAGTESKAEPAAKPAAKPEPDRHLAIVGGDVYVGDGTVLRGATVLIENDKIKAVGHDLELPEDCTKLDAAGKVVSPGFCIPIAPNLGTPSGGDSAKDGANPFDPDIKLALAVGITSYLWQSGNGSDKPGGHSALVKLSWGDLEGMIAMEDPVVTMRVPLNVQQMRSLREFVKKAKDHLDKVAAAAKEKDAKPPEAPRGTEDVLAVMTGEKKLWIGVARGFGGGSFDIDAIRQALEISRLFGVGVVLDQPTEAWLLPDEIAATGSMAIVAPRERVRPDPGRPEGSGSNLAMAAILDAAGVPVAVTVNRAGFGAGPYIGTGGILGQDLNTPTLDPAFAVRGGYPNGKALRTITLDAARTIGAEARVGSLEAGKDADVLILDGDPLNYKTFVETTLVNGKVVYQKDEEPYYQHVGR